MAQLFDDNGVLVEGALTADEVKAIQAQAETAAKELEAAKEQLTKFQNKDLNFQKLRDLTAEERKKLSTREIELMQRQEQLEEKQKGFVETQINSYKEEALAALAKGDEELRKKTLLHFDRIKDEATGREEIRRKMLDAYHLAKFDSATGSDPFAAAMGYTGGQAPMNKAETAEFNAELKNLAGRFGLSEADLKKYYH